MTGPTTRRGLIGAALAGVAVGGAAPFVLPDHPDAKLLSLCAELEAVQRRINGLWAWRVDGVSRSTASFIEDDDEREAIVTALEEELWPIHLQIYDLRATTIDGMRAKARCLLLVDGEMRDLADETLEENKLGLYAVTSNLLATLLQDLSDKSITDATCADGPLTGARP